MNLLTTVGLITSISILVFHYIPEVKKGQSPKEKKAILRELLVEPFMGLSVLFYISIFSIIFGIYIN